MMTQISTLPANVIFCGHTHIPYIREVAGKLIVNPGSLGQSRSGKPVSSYAIWDDGKIELKSYEYPIESTIKRINSLGFPEEISDELAQILLTATV